MAKCCPRACGRLATAAVFISVGIVQVIAAIILLKSKYAYLLFGPNILTALCNLTVGILLGVASTVWKSINKNSNKHANRRKFLASLVGSILLLNSTTAAMLIIGEGNNLLAIDLENGGVHSNKTLNEEILAYAYSTSVCSPIVCVVVSIAFLTGIVFRQKPKTIKTLDFKNILNADDALLYDWVYTSDLPKPHPELLKSAFSSTSESSSSDSESDSSTDLPVPLHLRSLSDIKNSQHGSLKSGFLPFSATRNLTDSMSSDFLKTRRIPRLKHSSIVTTPVRSYDESLNACRTLGFGSGAISSMVDYKSDCRPGTPVRIGSPSVLNKSTYSPNFQFNSSLSQGPTKAKLSFSPMNQSTESRLGIMNGTKYMSMEGPSTSFQSPMENSSDCEDMVFEVIDLSSKRNIHSPNSHSKICRTSTTDQTKAYRELENLDDSAIHLDAGVAAFKEIYIDETLPEVNDKEGLSSNCLTDSAFEEKNLSYRSGGDLSMIVRDSNFRKKLSSRLVPAATPVVSDSCSLYKTPNRKSIKRGRMKPYSKSNTSYDKYLQTGFSSFKDEGQVDKVDGSFHTPKLMTSISEKPTEEVLDSFLPSTSTHTSGYMSASYEESEDEVDLKSNLSLASRQQPSSPAQQIADEIRERYRKKTERVSFKVDNDR